MDTIKLKFKYSLPTSNEHFKDEKIGKNSVRYWTNHSWSKKRKNMGIYTPTYYIQEEFYDRSNTYLWIEASLPKLLNGESMLTELNTQDVDKVVKAIKEFFIIIDVSIFTKQILTAVPTLVAISRNIKLETLCTANMGLNVLSPFDYRPRMTHRMIEFYDGLGRGKEVIFSTAEETIKVYDKKRAMINTAKTKREKEIVNMLKMRALVVEILRVELTFKTPRRIRTRFKKYLGKKTMTLENIFNKEVWDEIIREEMNRIYNHPLKLFVFLAGEQKPIIDAVLDCKYKHIDVKDRMWGIINSIQEFGLQETMRRFLRLYTKQTWYNYLGRLEELSEHIDYIQIQRLSNYKIHRFILNQLGVNTQKQVALSLNSKAISQNK